MGKLNASYFWGKEQLLFKTISNEFGIEIDKFIQIDFEGLMDVITQIGVQSSDNTLKTKQKKNKTKQNNNNNNNRVG